MYGPGTQRFHSTHYVSDLMHELGMPADGHGIGDAFSVGGVRVTVTPADHAWQNAAPKPGQRTFHDEDSCGFWIETLDGVIWAPGDSRLIREHHLTMPTPDALLFDFVHGEVSGARIQVRNTERGSAIRTTSTNDEHGPGFAGRLTQLPGRNPLSSANRRHPDKVMQFASDLTMKKQDDTPRPKEESEAEDHIRPPNGLPKKLICAQSEGQRPLTCGNTVPEVGLEPTHLSIPHFECGASANSATRARKHRNKAN
jgi:hypothetical protein